VQAPSWQLSPVVQALLSVHDAPSGLLGLLQLPVAGLHTPGSWHWSWAWQTTGIEPVQAPVTQVSTVVQALLSLQVEPSDFGGLLHAPVAGLHTPGS
jgi:hypothetical protein